MTKLTAHRTYDPLDGIDMAEPPYVIASIHPASEKAVQLVLSADVDSEDGRSQFMWVRLPNGDLILGVFPQGDTYFAVEQDARYPD